MKVASGWLSGGLLHRYYIVTTSLLHRYYIVLYGLQVASRCRSCRFFHGFRLPTLRNVGTNGRLKTEVMILVLAAAARNTRNAACQRTKLIPAAPPPIAETPEPIAAPVEDDWQKAEPLDEDEAEEPGNIADAPERPPLHKYPRPERNLPDLPPEQKKTIEAWWKETSPCYRERDADQMIQRVETALTEFPSLFVHLALDEEFLFELGGELGRRGRMPDYIALLQRLRREQRQMYSFSYGAYDSDVIAELVVTGQVEQIPAYLDLFKQYPDAQPDYCHQICNLLAWRGLAEPLYLLCEAVATPMLTSSEVISGNFALDWLLRREEIPFFEGGDDSPGALERTADAITRLGERVQFPLKPNVDWLRAGLKAFLEPPRAGLRGTLSDLAQSRLGLNFVSYLRRARLVPWVQGFLLGDLLQDYFCWCRRERKPWLRLQKKDIEAFAVYRSKSFFCVLGVTVLAILQGMVWFAEYLAIATAISAAEAERIKQDCRQLFEAGRKAVDSTDPAYRVCPTFEQLTVVTAS